MKNIILVATIAVLTACSAESTVEPVTDTTWYNFNGFSCKNTAGPNELVKIATSLNIEYIATVNQRVGDIVTIVTIQIPSENSAGIFVKGKTRCDALVQSFANSRN